MNGFQSIAVVGVGMMGATLARALRHALPQAEICGYDVRKPPASAPSGVDRWADSPEEAWREADLVVLATPVTSILELLPRAARSCRPEALVTDAGSTKSAVCALARREFKLESGPYFIGGHPMAGRERGGAQASDPDLLRGAPYALCPDARVPSLRRQALEELVRAIGARPLWIEPEDHDRITAMVSHMPQLAIVALASLLEEAASDEARLPELTGSALHDLLRIASSPYPLWHDICRTNAAPLREALEDLARRLKAIAGDLERGKELAQWFEEAQHFRDQRLRIR